MHSVHKNLILLDRNGLLISDLCPGLRDVDDKARRPNYSLTGELATLFNIDVKDMQSRIPRLLLKGNMRIFTC